MRLTDEERKLAEFNMYDVEWIGSEEDRKPKSGWMFAVWAALLIGMIAALGVWL